MHSRIVTCGQVTVEVACCTRAEAKSLQVNLQPDATRLRTYQARSQWLRTVQVVLENFLDTVANFNKIFCNLIHLCQSWACLRTRELCQSVESCMFSTKGPQQNQDTNRTSVFSGLAGGHCVVFVS